MVNSYYGIYQADPGKTASDAGMRSGPSPLTGLRLDLPCTEDPELFFAESPQDVEQAKVMCQGCPARRGCDWICRARRIRSYSSPNLRRTWSRRR